VSACRRFGLGRHDVAQAVAAHVEGAVHQLGDNDREAVAGLRGSEIVC